ncbi:MAG: 3-hydroxyacyl-ACP dehydratase FabZ family protein [Planctomycetota bacterium]|jgi:3-hydroxyacyl-[acyl-carrier-protein] dehydratase
MTPLDQLPHRPPFRFVSSLTAIAPGSGRGVWSVSGEEAFLAGHFPGEPIVPGVLIGEALAQLAGIVAFAETGPGGPPALLASLDVRFEEAVRPPVDIELEADHTRSLGHLHLFDVRAMVAGSVVTRGSLALAARPAGDAPS